jgi:hypothetical protein
MKREWALKWVKALRSGKYKQARGVLKDNAGHCCLGVLCTLTPYKNNYTRMPVESFGFRECNKVLPPAVQDLVGMQSNNGKINLILPELSKLNDDGKSFNEIADIIEKYWGNL